MANTEIDTQHEDLQGMPAAVYNALKAHPQAVRDIHTGRVVCAGADCDWVRPAGKTGKRAFLSHQTWAVQLAVAEWYFSDM